MLVILLVIKVEENEGGHVNRSKETKKDGAKRKDKVNWPSMNRGM